ncbi:MULTISPECIES: hypothetical protein [unclassified Mucilaginibacter]|uniref:hypothetical protein n=1 Tax=unclassified Mucilaginibacter TaxID=2617802 RepID=UPI000968051B|nr:MULTISPECIES: hypothetical protein [unclassified Mucilaginibacter]OJW18495.1 MAG: hypothetical protein BGO48_18345 [Mucilaginibacter sp. 44-25]PLW91071.1 MAG: hypothetical protein C0154_03220 [Mucilaginibacter sp.]HEK21480.1 hypothetical protein [Bacteroidota bacterium]
MNIVSFPKKISYFLLAGLLIISFTLLLGQFTKLPDFARGALMGAGIGMEIIAINRLAVYKKKLSITENR